MKGVGGWCKIFMEIFNSMLHGFLPFSPVSSKNSAQVSGQTCPSQEPLALTKLMTSPAVEGTWIYTGGLIKKLKNRLSLIFSPDFTLKGLIWLFYTEKWIFLKKLQRA